MKVNILRTAFILAFLAVLFGAFAAHMLKGMLEPARVLIFETGVRYQFYHAIGLAICGLLSASFSSKKINWAARLFFLGILCFSGSLYLLALRDVLGIAHWTWIGPITPIGGVFFLMAWLSLFWATFDDKA